MQQLLRLLHSALRERKFKEYTDFGSAGAGPQDSRSRNQGDCHYRSQHRGLRQDDRREFPRSAETPQRRGRHRTLQDLVNRAESHNGGHRGLDSLRHQVPATLPYSFTVRVGHDPQKGGPPLHDGILRRQDRLHPLQDGS